MRIEQLTFTRFLAAIAIVFYHTGKNTFFLQSPHLSFLFKQANVGVSYFFILSGFVMVIAYSKNVIDYKKFYISRLARIYPLYFLALLSVAAMKLLFYSSGCSPVEFALSALVIHAWVPPYPMVLNTPGWSISVEFFFYAVFPVLMNLAYRKYSFKKVAVGIVCFWLASQVAVNICKQYIVVGENGQYNAMYYIVNHSPLMHLNEFLIGNLTGMVFLKMYGKYNFKYNTIAILLSVVGLYFLLKYRANIPLVYHNGLLAIVFVPFILFLSLDKTRLSNILSHKALVFLGEISFGIYILQHTVHLYFSQIFGYLGFGYNFYAHLITIIVVSALCYMFIEKPARDYINKLARTRWQKGRHLVTTS